MPNSAPEKIKLARKHWILLVVLLVAVGSMGALSAAITDNKKPDGCTENYRNDGFIQTNNKFISIESATTDTDRKKGLSDRNCISDDVGMLFSFDKPGSYDFWMKDMRFPIDMLWLDSNHRVVDIHAGVQPSSYPSSFSSSSPAQYVLELGAGQSKVLDIHTGSQLNF